MSEHLLFMQLNQITLPTTDMSASVKFYQALGLRIIVNAAPRYVRFLNPADKATLSLHTVDGEKSGEGPVIYFELADLDARVAELQAAGLVFEHGPVDQSWLWREARLRDPYGNLIVLYYGGENRVDPPWKVEATESAIYLM